MEGGQLPLEGGYLLGEPFYLRSLFLAYKFCISLRLILFSYRLANQSLPFPCVVVACSENMVL